MVQRNMWSEVGELECWERTGRPPATTPLIRSRLVARDFKVRGEKDNEDLFAATPPLELIRLLLSRTASLRMDRRVRKMLFIDAEKAHLNPRCDEDVYVELPAEAGAAAGKCGRLNNWLYGFRPAAQA